MNIDKEFSELKKRKRFKNDGKKKKSLILKYKRKKEIDKANFDLEQAENNYDLETAAKLRHGTIPRLEKELAELKNKNQRYYLILLMRDDIAAIIS